MPKLVIYSDRTVSQSFELGSGFTVGRAEHCSYSVDNPYISRVQATFAQDQETGDYAVHDGVLSGDTSFAQASQRPSRNGVWVNSGRIQGRRVLRDGDRVTFSDSQIVIEFSDADATVKSDGKV